MADAALTADEDEAEALALELEEAALEEAELVALVLAAEDEDEALEEVAEALAAEEELEVVDPVLQLPRIPKVIHPSCRLATTSLPLLTGAAEAPVAKRARTGRREYIVDLRVGG